MKRWHIGKTQSGSAEGAGRSGSASKSDNLRGDRPLVIRPHCKAGDAVLFDARILHFGIANASLNVHRPLLFVNYSRLWFSDFQPGGEIIVRHK